MLNLLTQVYPELKKLPRKEQERGGFYPELDYGVNAYDRVKASYFHYVVSDGVPKTKLPDNENLVNAFNCLVDYCGYVWKDHYVFQRLPLGEVCIRVLYYEGLGPDLKWSIERSHTDFCAFTVPLFDSKKTIGDTFYGEMVRIHKIQQFRGISPFKHGFSAFSEPRIYVVGFCQLPFNHVDDTGESYGYQLNKLIRGETGVSKNYDV